MGAKNTKHGGASQPDVPRQRLLIRRAQLGPEGGTELVGNSLETSSSEDTTKDEEENQYPRPPVQTTESHSGKDRTATDSIAPTTVGSGPRKQAQKSAKPRKTTKRTNDTPDEFTDFE